MSIKQRVAATIEARMSSTRLPGKVLMESLGKPLLEYMVERLRRCRKLDDIILATTTSPADDVLEEFAGRIGLKCYRGSENDVLLRVVEAAEEYGVDVIVETTGDCPLIDPQVVDKVVQVYLENDYDFVANTLKKTYPRGLDTRVFSTKGLRQVEGITDNPADREHVSLYFYEVPGRYSLYNVESGLPEKYWRLRLTVDTIEDFKLVDEIFKRLYPSNPEFLLSDILQLFDSEPALFEINRHITQKKVR